MSSTLRNAACAYQSSAIVSAVEKASSMVLAITPVGPRFTHPAQYIPGICLDESEVDHPLLSLTTRPNGSFGMMPRLSLNGISRSENPGNASDLYPIDRKAREAGR
ncbi:hypothetical protein BPOR_0080g00070 [Botrytis porri]|uniref:Uncharacterized protein n=1 Tax=Botrytis porri TaxID=87229 RepID=A0A4Z1KZU3_9HELO|nr:hypothetical protein BPOR_0080g00070 [Botrytis porri]